MNRHVKLMILFAAAAFALCSCESSPPPAGPPPEPQSAEAEIRRDFSDILGKSWNLVDARIKPHEIIFERGKLAETGFREIFTLRFDAETVSGVGAPNRYSAPYTRDGDQALTVNMVRATLMAPLHEPEKLKERDFFAYLQNTERWNFAGENLELHSKDTEGGEILLVFAPAD